MLSNLERQAYLPPAELKTVENAPPPLPVRVSGNVKNCDAASRIARNNKIFYELAETKKFVTLLVKYLCIIEPEGSDKQWVRILKKIKVGDDFEGQAHRERILRKTSAHDFQKAEQRLIKACSMLITELSEELKEGAVCR